MDFISFSSTPVNRQGNSSPQTKNQDKRHGSSQKNGENMSNLPAFGSPAVGSQFGGIPFGSPAITNPAFSPQNRCTSPRHPNHQQFTPRGYNYNSSPRQRFNQNQHSPRHQNSQQFTPSPYASRNNFRDSNDGSGFKTPHQFSPGRGRGNGRKSFTRQFGQTSRNDPNCNAGGSLNIEDYYHPSMVQDPWRNICPVLAQAFT